VTARGEGDVDLTVCVDDRECGALWPYALHGEVEVGVLPALAARPGLGALPYTRVRDWFEVGIRYGDGRRRFDLLPIRIGSGATWQDGRYLREDLAEAAIVRTCRRRGGDAPERCLDVVAFDMTGVAGDHDLAVGTFWPVRVRGVAVGDGAYLDVAAGVGGTGTMTTSVDGEVVSVIDTDGVPDVAAGLYDVALAHRGGGVDVDVQARRSLVVWLDGDLSVDDRLSAELRWARGASAWTARGFVARTLTFTERDAPGVGTRSGGGELSLSRPLRGYDLGVSVAVARSYYARVGDSGRAVGLGGQGSLTLRRRVASRHRGARAQ
ncbi:MAG: hypothetical protein KC464_03330, partial [Myxococcales bacterium]|nr:hypothetical protein [Myxococcales bacterium]